MKPLIALQLISAMFFLLPLEGHAGGYRVTTQGIKAVGMAQAGVAMSENAESVFLNPAAITQIDADAQIVTGLTLIDSKNRYQNTDTNISASTSTPLSIVPNFYLTLHYNDDISLGFGLYTPYGSSVEWERDWAGSHLVNNIELQAVFLQPTVAFAVNETVSLGIGPIVAVGAVELNRNLSTSLQNSEGRSNVTIEDSGIIEYGVNVGLWYQVNSRLDLGINYRSEITMESEGSADFENIPNVLQNTFQDGRYQAELPLPAELTLGLAYSVNEELLLAFDVNYVYWNAYESLDIEFDSVSDSNSNPSSNPRNYQNSAVYRFGLQYRPNDAFTYRAGIYYDETPIRDGYFAPETPRTDAIGVTLGFSWQISEQWQLDTSAFYLHFPEEDNSYDFSSEGVFEGRYKVRAYSLGFGLTYEF